MKHVLGLAIVLILSTTNAPQPPVAGPAADASVKSERVFLAGGCYWGVEAVFEHVRGVRSVVSGFARPAGDTTVGGGKLRHTTFVETVRIDYDPSKVSYERLLEIFFLIAHDPTQVDRQTPDVGPQYRSMVFVDGATQAQVVDSVLAQVRAKRAYSTPIVTEIALLLGFREASDDQQDYVVKNPEAPYVRNHDVPKLVKLQQNYPSNYR